MREKDNTSPHLNAASLPSSTGRPSVAAPDVRTAAHPSRAPKSYWARMSVRTERDQEACKSWFEPFIETDLKLESADVLCDVASDREKGKIRCVGVTPDGERFRYTLNRGARNSSIKRERLPAPELKSVEK